jgi:hypothetical protein
VVLHQMSSQSARVPVTEQGNLTSDDVDDVIVNEKNVITILTHESHEHWTMSVQKALNLNKGVKLCLFKIVC